MECNFPTMANQHIEDCRTLNRPIEEAAFPIIISAKKYTDEEVKRTLFALPGDVMAEIELLLSEYTKTGEYYVISSAGTRDLSELMKRICRLVSEKVRDDDN